MAEETGRGAYVIKPDPLPRGRVAQLKSLTDRITRGEREARGELRALLKEDWEIWNAAADLEGLTEKVLLGLVTSERNPLGIELFGEQVDALRRELLGVEPTPLEKLMVGRLVLSWLFAAMTDHMLACALEQNKTAADYWARVAATADRRVQSAVKTLALVKRLQLPLVLQQTNIQADQVIVGQETPPPLELEERSRT